MNKIIFLIFLGCLIVFFGVIAACSMNSNPSQWGWFLAMSLISLICFGSCASDKEWFK